MLQCERKEIKTIMVTLTYSYHLQQTSVILQYSEQTWDNSVHVLKPEADLQKKFITVSQMTETRWYSENYRIVWILKTRGFFFNHFDSKLFIYITMKIEHQVNVKNYK